MKSGESSFKWLEKNFASDPLSGGIEIRHGDMKKH